MVFGIDDALMVGGIASLAGNLIGSSENMDAVNAQNAANIQLSRENQAFQERMSNTAYQRQMADMRAAGLNPVLAATKGGASTPTGSVAHVEAGDPGQGMRDLGSSALQMAQLDNQMKATSADINLKAAQTAESLVRAKNTDANTALALAEGEAAPTFYQSRAAKESAQSGIAQVGEKTAMASQIEGIAAARARFAKDVSDASASKTAASRAASIEAHEAPLRKYDYWVKKSMGDLGIGSSAKDFMDSLGGSKLRSDSKTGVDRLLKGIYD